MLEELQMRPSRLHLLLPLNPLRLQAGLCARACWEGPELKQQLVRLIKAASSQGVHRPDPRVILPILMTLSLVPLTLECWPGTHVVKLNNAMGHRMAAARAVENRADEVVLKGSFF